MKMQILLLLVFKSNATTLNEYLAYSSHTQGNKEKAEFVASQCSSSYMIAELKAVAKLSEFGNEVTINSTEKIVTNGYKLKINSKTSNYKVSYKVISKAEFDNGIFCVLVGNVENN